MAAKRVMNRMYEPWGYREQNKYKSFGEDMYIFESFFSDARYSKKDNKIHFYNEESKELCTINVGDFPQAKVISSVYNTDTKVLVITFDNGDTTEINLTEAINEIEEYILNQTQSGFTALSGAIESEIVRATTIEQNLLEIIEAIADDAFADMDYAWNQGDQKMSLNMYNIKNELKDSVDLFDTDEDGAIILNGGDF